MIKFLHVADIHLDSQLKGLNKRDEAPVDIIRKATRRALENVVRYAIEERVDFIVIAGDLYDGDWKDANTGLFFSQQMHLLKEADISAYLIRGNHDAQSEITRSLHLPDNVRNFRTDVSETITLDDFGVAIHGQGFASRAVTKDLSKSYPQKIEGLFNIGLLHTSVTGREGHENYAPCTLEGLREKKYDYWALGHVHNREILCAESKIVFPGNLQGRHIRETGEKGAILVSISDDLTCETEFIPFDVMRWEHPHIDLTDVKSIDDAHQLFESALADVAGQHPDHHLALRITLTGRNAIHHELNSDHAGLTANFMSLAQNFQDRVWIEKVKVSTTDDSDRQALLSSQDGLLGTLLSLVDRVNNNSEVLKDIGCDIDSIRSRLPSQIREQIFSHNPDYLESLIGAAESKLMKTLKVEK